MLALSTALALLSPTAVPAETSTPLPTFEPAARAALFATSADDKRAADFSYTFIQLGYTSTNIDAINDDSKGLAGRASLGLGFLYLFLDYSNPTTDYQNTNVDNYGLGAGVHFSLVPRLDLVGEAAWLSSDISSDLSTLDQSNDGWTAMTGARWMPLPWDGGGLELDGGFRWIDLKGLLSDTQTSAWEVGARVHFLKMLSVGASYTFLEQDKQWGLNARVAF
jgi:hypothetical protein